MTFHGIVVFAVQVFQIKSMLFLRVESTIFNCPSATSPNDHRFHILVGYWKISNEIERVFLIGSPVFNHIYRKSSVINACHIIMPDFSLCRLFLLTLALQQFQWCVFPIDRRNASLLESKEILPLFLPAFPEKGLTGVQTVRADAYRQTGKCPLQPFHQTPARF